jgi:uncharacterized protein YyaL (SSP411 family)
MEKESFRDKQVASLMNRHFVSIKVDREERPDIDHVYMQAAYTITGSGGWPLNVIALPDGRPVYAGTYFPKEKWKHILAYFAELLESRPELLEQQAAQVHEHIKPDALPRGTVSEDVFDKNDIRHFHKIILRTMDPELGGTYGAPKFPMPVILEFLLQYHARNDDKESFEALKTSLDAMASGGIYDHIGGGFCRYATDAAWKVPHFEKMLYDNAQLISLYSKAFKLSGDEVYRQVVKDTIAFAGRELMSPEGAFYSAIDADSDGEEGRFYVWERSEVERLAGEDAEEFCKYYNIEEAGNWENTKNILYRDPGHGRPSLDDHAFSGIRQKMLEQRGRRTRPATDDKILTAWNALMISGLADAYEAFGEEKYLDMALKNARFLEKHMIDRDFRLFRNYKDGKISINAFLDDYALLSEAYLKLYSISFDEHWLSLAREISAYAFGHFYHHAEKRFYYTSSKDPELVFRPLESSDNVIPSSSSKMVQVMDMLAYYFDNKQYREIVTEVLSGMKATLRKHPSFHAQWCMLSMNRVYPAPEVVILGKDARKINRQLGKRLLPGMIVSGSEKKGTLSHFQYKYIEGKTMVYVCRKGSCRQAVDNAEAALEQILDILKFDK